MLNQIFQLTQPKNITIKYQEEDMSREDKVLIRPYYMAICHADQRYYQGKRDPKVLKKKLPMALIHESSGIVVADREPINQDRLWPWFPINLLIKQRVSSLKIIWRGRTSCLVALMVLCRKSLPYRWIV